ncbi:MAG: 16S rRNA (guanine(527)-N(7))-methyltransferase RsmG [bacterium]|nr:16S rRNA (guanine(527)-N(7))-methyltransferase RsmG [bacterium]
MSEIDTCESLDQKVLDFFNKCNIPDLERFIKKCRKFKHILIEENKKHNLTRITDDFEFWNRHIADSLSITLFFANKISDSTNIADVGCGAGFPSIVLAIAFPKVTFTAIDSRHKKTDFVQFAANYLKLKNIKVVTGRARELKYNKDFDIVTARAVADPFKLYTEIKKWPSKNGNIILYQTPINIVQKQKDVTQISTGQKIQWKTTPEFELPGKENRLFLFSTKRI